MLAIIALLLLPPSIEPYSGTWKLAANATTEIRQAIDTAVAKMNFLIRGIARGRLLKTQVAFPTLTIEGEGSAVRIAHEGGTDVTHADPSDTIRTNAPDGEPIVVKLQPGPPLKQSYESKDGRRENTYVLSEDGKRLTVEVLVTSPRLPAPVQYELHYRRM